MFTVIKPNNFMGGTEVRLTPDGIFFSAKISKEFPSKYIFVCIDEKDRRIGFKEGKEKESGAFKARLGSRKRCQSLVITHRSLIKEILGEGYFDKNKPPTIKLEAKDHMWIGDLPLKRKTKKEE